MMQLKWKAWPHGNATTVDPEHEAKSMRFDCGRTAGASSSVSSSAQRSFCFDNLNNIIVGYFDPENVFL